MSTKNIYRFKNTDFNFLKKEIDLRNTMPLVAWPRRWVTNLTDMLTDEARQWLISVGIGPGRENDSARVFETKPKYSCNIHNDGSYNTGKLTFYSRWSINYVWGGCKDGSMSWYSPKPDLLEKYADYKSVLGHIPQVYDPEKLVEIERDNYISGLALVRIDIPHQVTNNDSEFSRWCISIRTGVIKDASWEDSIEYFKPHLIMD
jgi:hypothetical protein